MEINTPDNYKLLCRLCGKHEMVSMDIFGQEGNIRELKEKIELCLPLEVSKNDLLPNNLCYRCLLNLENFHDFYNQTLKSVAALESLIVSTKSCIRNSNHSKKSSPEIFTSEKNPSPSFQESALTYDKYTITEPCVLLIDQSTLTDNIIITNNALCKEQYTITNDILKQDASTLTDPCITHCTCTNIKSEINKYNEYPSSRRLDALQLGRNNLQQTVLSNRNDVDPLSKLITAPHKRILSLVDYDSDTNSSGADSNAYADIKSKLEDTTLSNIIHFNPVNKSSDVLEPETSKIISEISLRKDIQNRKRPSSNIFNLICTKKQKLYHPNTESEHNSSRRKNKQPKKIENHKIVTKSRHFNPTNVILTCLLCDKEHESQDLLTKHLYEAHGLEPKEIFDPNAVIETENDIDYLAQNDRSPKARKMPNLVRITDVLLNKNDSGIKTKSDSNTQIKKETVSSDSENESQNVLQAPKLAPGLFNLDVSQLESYAEALWNERQYFADNTQKILSAVAHNGAGVSPTNLGTYICQICARDFNDRASLWLHLRATHPKHASLACGVCLRLCVSWGELREHVQNEHNPHKMTVSEIRKYYCIICLRQHDSRKKLLNHVYVHDFLVEFYKKHGHEFDAEAFVKINFTGTGEECNNDVSGRQSVELDDVAVNENSILYSQLIKDEKIEQDIEEISEDFDENGSNKGEQSVELKHSSFIMSAENEMDTDIVYKAGGTTSARNYTLTYACEWCARALPSKWARWQHVAMAHAPTNAALRCSLPHCRKVFVSEALRAEHEQHHQIQGSVPNSCEVCCKLWNTRVDFYKHMMGVHPHAVPLVCGVCLKIFPTVLKLYSHVQNTHLPLQGDFVCNVCGRSYTNKSKMVRHRRIHGVTDSGIFLPSAMQQAQRGLIKTNELRNKSCGGIAQRSKLENLAEKSIDSIYMGDMCNLSNRGSDSENDFNASERKIEASKCIPKLENYECKDCPGAKFSTYDEFSTHKRVLHQIFHCDLCTKYYGRNSHLWKHVNRCHKGNKVITCQLCFKTSASKYHLQQHFNKIHALKSDKLKGSPNTSNSIESFLDKKIDGYNFDSVKQSFLRQELLEREKQAMIESAKSEEPLYSPNESVSDIAETEANNSNIKSKAPRELDTSSDLYTSIITNYSPPVNVGPHKCNKCGKGFHKRYLLKKHKKNCRPRLQENLLTRCKACERIFKDRQSLQKHLANYHSEFKCHLCDITYASKCEIISHVRFTHPKHPDFVCDCGQILRSKSDLHEHRSDHRNSHVCQFCGDNLPSKIKLKMHILSLHRKILSLSCGICLKLFASQHVLRDHVKLVHFKDTKYGNACSVCGKKYGSKWKCFDHINKSHGKIFIPCKICLNVFEDEEEMKTHFQTVHLGLGAPPRIVDETGDRVKNECFSDTEMVDNEENMLDIKPSLLESRLSESKIVPKLTLTSLKNRPENYTVKTSEVKDNEHTLKSEFNYFDEDLNSLKTQTLHNSSKRTVYENSDSPSMCEICLKTWPAKKHLWQHYIRCHKSVAATICGICLKTNKSYMDLKKHLLEKHPSLLHGRGFGSNFICKICGRYHNASSKLKLHMVIHVGYDSADLEIQDIRLQNNTENPGLNFNINDDSKRYEEDEERIDDSINRSQIESGSDRSDHDSYDIESKHTVVEKSSNRSENTVEKTNLNEVREEMLLHELNTCNLEYKEEKRRQRLQNRCESVESKNISDKKRKGSNIYSSDSESEIEQDECTSDQEPDFRGFEQMTSRDIEILEKYNERLTAVAESLGYIEPERQDCEDEKIEELEESPSTDVGAHEESSSSETSSNTSNSSESEMSDDESEKSYSKSDENETELNTNNENFQIEDDTNYSNNSEHSQEIREKSEDEVDEEIEESDIEEIKYVEENVNDLEDGEEIYLDTTENDKIVIETAGSIDLITEDEDNSQRCYVLNVNMDDECSDEIESRNMSRLGDNSNISMAEVVYDEIEIEQEMLNNMLGENFVNNPNSESAIKNAIKSIEMEDNDTEDYLEQDDCIETSIIEIGDVVQVGTVEEVAEELTENEIETAIESIL